MIVNSVKNCALLNFSGAVFVVSQYYFYWQFFSKKYSNSKTLIIVLDKIEYSNILYHDEVNICSLIMDEIIIL